MAEQFLKELQNLVEFQREVSGFHPAFEGHYPIAIVADGQFLIYDWADEAGAYALVKTAPLHMEIPEGVMAAFPLAPYGGQTTAVVTPATFERSDWMVMLLHEFVHCYQNTIGVDDLRDRLTICREAEARGHVTWEIDHPFPFAEEAFVAVYTSLLGALAQDDPEAVRRIRKGLKQVLPLRALRAGTRTACGIMCPCPIWMSASSRLITGSLFTWAARPISTCWCGITLKWRRI